MQRITHTLIAGLVLAIIGLIVNACGSGSSSATDTLTSAEQTQVQSMINSAVTAATTPLKSDISTLQTQLAAAQSTIQTLQANQPAVYIRSGSAAVAAIANAALHHGGRSLESTTTYTTTCLGTLTGRPSSSDPRLSNDLAGIGCSGYVYVISGAATASDFGAIQPLGDGSAILFDGPNCTGNMYVSPQVGYGSNLSTFSAAAIASGVVFRYDPAHIGNGGDTDASTYYMVPAAEASQSVSIASMFLTGPSNHTCTSISLTANFAYLVAQNDPSITGLPNAPITGPVIATQ